MKTENSKNTGRKKKTGRKTLRKKKARVHQETDFLNQGTHTLNRDSDFQETDYWLNTCSLKDPGKMKNLEIPGCGELVHLDCYGGCLNIQKVINHFQSKRIREIPAGNAFYFIVKEMHCETQSHSVH